MTFIQVCDNPNCHHSFQDLVYGKRRVFNEVKNKVGNSVAGRCTVCERIAKKSGIATVI